MTIRICVTGGIACGKSLVAGFLEEAGIPVIDADEVCHDLMRPGRPEHARIVAAFGPQALSADGEIDRARLGRVVFGSDARKAELEAILHPAAGRVIEAWIAGHPGAPLLSAVVPLVYEAGWESKWDFIVCVAAPACLQLDRLAARGLSPEDAGARLAAQMPVEEKMRRADRVIFNAGPVALARQQTKALIEGFNEQGEISNGRQA